MKNIKSYSSTYIQGKAIFIKNDKRTLTLLINSL